MKIRVDRAEYSDLKDMRELYCQELDCQIVHYSFLARGLADPYLVHVDGRVGGYAAVSNTYDKGRLVEFYVLPDLRGAALPIFREILHRSQATHIEVQTNSPLMLLMLFDCATNIIAEKVLFRDGFITHLACPRGVFRQNIPGGDWVIEADGNVVATGGYLCHYNPPYGDLYMEVAEPARRQGFGSYLVQELKRVCREAGNTPAARCDPTNIASRATLERGGLVACGHLLVGEVKP